MEKPFSDGILALPDMTNIPSGLKLASKVASLNTGLTLNVDNYVHIHYKSIRKEFECMMLVISTKTFLLSWVRNTTHKCATEWIKYINMPIFSCQKHKSPIITELDNISIGQITPNRKYFKRTLQEANSHMLRACWHLAWDKSSQPATNLLFMFLLIKY